MQSPDVEVLSSVPGQGWSGADASALDGQDQRQDREAEDGQVLDEVDGGLHDSLLLVGLLGGRFSYGVVPCGV